MSVAEMAALIGATGGYRPSRDLQFQVRVLDVRTRYGTVDVLIAPVAGNGTQWVTLDRFTPDPGHAPAIHGLEDAREELNAALESLPHTLPLAI